MFARVAYGEPEKVVNMADNIHLTVAAVVPRQGKYLLVRESRQQGYALNQPAGHVMPGECPITAVKRETLEETGWTVSPSALLGFATYTAPGNGVTYYRFSFLCEALHHNRQLSIDPDITEVLWLDRRELPGAYPLRSPLVLDAIKQYESGLRYPLEFMRDYR